MALRPLLQPKYVVPGLVVYTGAVYGAYRLFAPAPAPPTVTSRPGASTWDQLADQYDAAIDSEELFMGMPLLRRRLLTHARGAVLEVSCGTGRNLKYYPSDTVVVGTDASPAMVATARHKASSTPALRDRVSFVPADTARLPFPSNHFDTVVQTFGLCSVDDPEAALREMQRVCRPGGKVLLLEHGRSGNHQWLTRRLDERAERHRAEWGCWWNRNIEQLLERSGLQVQSLWRWHFGTTYYVVAAPGDASGQAPSPVR